MENAKRQKETEFTYFIFSIQTFIKYFLHFSHKFFRFALSLFYFAIKDEFSFTYPMYNNLEYVKSFTFNLTHNINGSRMIIF